MHQLPAHGHEMSCVLQVEPRSGVFPVAQDNRSGSEPFPEPAVRYTFEEGQNPSHVLDAVCEAGRPPDFALGCVPLNDCNGCTGGGSAG